MCSAVCIEVVATTKKSIAASEEDGSFLALSREGKTKIYGYVICNMHYILGNLTVTSNLCQSNLCHCKFVTTMKLPCHHVFTVRGKQGLPLYSSDGIAE